MTPGSATAILLKYMRATVRLGKTVKPNFPHGSHQSFALKYGQAYEPQCLPKGFRMGRPKQCYYNSAVQALRKPNLIYVEGFALAGGLQNETQHAWLVERGSNKVIERTHNFDAYFGIPFRTSFVRKRFYKQDGLPIMGNWDGGEEILYAMTDEEIRAVIDGGY